MNILKAMLLGIVQGLSEFFPISGSGNLYFFSNLFNIEAYTLSFDILLHTASLLALIFIYYKDILFILKNPTSKISKLVGAGILPIFIVSVLFQNKIDSFFLNSKILGLCFIVSGAVLFYETLYNPGKKTFKNMSVKNAFFIGGIQTAGVIPALSRTGFALSGGLQLGFNGKTSLKYAYLMSIPAMFGRILIDVIRIYQNSGETVTEVFGFLPMLIGFVFTFVSSVVAIRVMQIAVSKNKLRPFAYYMFAVGIIVLVDMLAVNKIF